MKKFSVHKRFLAWAAILGATGVALGAFGAHGLQEITTDPAILNSYETAARYQMIHALALLAVSILAIHQASRWIRWAGICFITGIFLFSGSLYLITYLKIEGNSVGLLGPITPLGGLFFVLGWIMLLLAALRSNGVKR